MNLFALGQFLAHSGATLEWKIECEALTDADWDCLAFLIARRIRFGAVRGIPRGGLKLAAALRRYCSVGPPLLVDDVWTTGASFARELRPGERGFVAFARTPVVDPVRALFVLTEG